MLIKWNEKTFRWFEDAAVYTGYYKNLTDLLLQHIPVRGTLCDLGCGMALTDFELAPNIGHITCLDINNDVINYVNQTAETLGVSNLSTVIGDARDLQGRFDTVMALFHGKPADFPKYLSLASDRFIAVVHGSEKGNVGPEAYKMRKCSSLEAVSAELESLGLTYELTAGSLEFGQPLRSMDAARDYVSTYTKTAPEEVLEDCLSKTLEKTGRSDFPYYLPNDKQFGIYVIRRSANEKL